MHAYDFIAKLLMNIESGNTLFDVTISNMKLYDYEEYQWINTDYCSVEPGKVILGISVIDDAPAENYIDTLYKLRDFFKKNNVKMTDKVYIEPTSGPERVIDFNVIKPSNDKYHHISIII